MVSTDTILDSKRNVPLSIICLSYQNTNLTHFFRVFIEVHFQIFVERIVEMVKFQEPIEFGGHVHLLDVVGDVTYI